MTTPATTDLEFYTNTPLKASNWKTNWEKLIDYLTDGTYDFTIQDLTCRNLTVSGTITYSGTVHMNTIVSKTTTQRDALTKSAGLIIYNSTIGKLEFCDGLRWYTIMA